MTKLLLLSDIHANFPALEAIALFFSDVNFDAICNCGDSLVYAPFPNETLDWLEKNKVHSIVGNTDRKVKKLLQGETFKKPRMTEKRIMYTWTADNLTSSSQKYILSLKKSKQLRIDNQTIHLFHGSPADPDEFLFPDTSPEHFSMLAKSCPSNIIFCGHSHTPFHRQVKNSHFINPGSVGRMFDSNPAASCAVVTIKGESVTTEFFRISWSIEKMIKALNRYNLPDIYQRMYTLGKKLN